MSATISTIKQTPEPQADPVRAELDGAIKAAWKSACGVTAAEECMVRGRDHLAVCESAAVEAKEAIATAREVDAKAAAKAIRQHIKVSDISATQRTRREIEDAEDALAVAQVAVEQLAASLADAVRAHAWSQNALLTARNRVLVAIAQQVLDRGRSARRELAVATALLPVLLQRDDGAPQFRADLDAIRAREARAEPLKTLYGEVERFFHGHGRDDDASEARSAVAAMSAAIARLTTDANASIELPLP